MMEYPRPYTVEQAQALWDRLTTEERTSFLKKANLALGMAEVDLLPYAECGWGNMPKNGVTPDVQDRLTRIAAEFETIHLKKQG